MIGLLLESSVRAALMAIAIASVLLGLRIEDAAVRHKA